MAPSVEITGSAVWGNGPMRYAVYKIDIIKDSDQWTVYRRYRDFLKLHTQLVTEIPDAMGPMLEIFPEKGQMGSLINSFDLVVNERLVQLREYIRQLMRIREVVTQPCFLDFVDAEFKGVSGFRRALGDSQVLKEGYALTSRGNFDFMFLFVWQTNYVGLTKRGILHVMSTLYDTPESSFVRIDLRSIDVRVGGDVSSRVVHVISGDTKVFIKFSTIDEFSSWLRQVSDFGIHTASQANVVGKANASKNAPPPTEKAAVREQHVRTKGTGNTDDDLSAMYGM